MQTSPYVHSWTRYRACCNLALLSCCAALTDALASWENMIEHCARDLCDEPSMDKACLRDRSRHDAEGIAAAC